MLPDRLQLQVPGGSFPHSATTSSKQFSSGGSVILAPRWGILKVLTRFSYGHWNASSYNPSSSCFNQRVMHLTTWFFSDRVACTSVLLANVAMCTLRTFYLQVDGFLPQFSVQLHFLNPLTLVPSAQWNTSSIQFFLCGNFQKNLFVGRFHWLQTTLSKIQMCIIQLIVLYEFYLWGIIQQFICIKKSTRRPNKIPKIIQEKFFKVNNS